VIYIDSPHTDPGFNLAAEEYLLNAFPEDILMLWQNSSSVIVGKHQDINAEVNRVYVQNRRIPVYRRQSGGGTVYHDAGNLNLSFIESGTQPDFTTYTERIRKALRKLGIEATSDERNALYLDGLKISGSAQFLRKGKVLFHATLLYASDLNALNASLDSPDFTKAPTEGSRKRIRSVKSPVTNIRDHLSEPLTMDVFRQRLLSTLLQEHTQHTPYTFSDIDLNAISAIKMEKYTTNCWNFQA
jgi:lipoate---protein ligase